MKEGRRPGAHRRAGGALTTERIEQWHALRMMIGFCREEAAALGAEFLVYYLDLGIDAADDHMRTLEIGQPEGSAGIPGGARPGVAREVEMAIGAER